MEKLATFLVGAFWALYDRFRAKKADQDHAAAVRADPGSAWLRRFGGKDARSDSGAPGNAKHDGN